MKSKRFHSDEVIQMTRDVLYSFYHRDPSSTASHMADDFVWIGANDFQWCQSRQEFIQTTKKEYEEPDVMMFNEEYHPLFHERNVWIVYGRYKISCRFEDGTGLYAHVRVTFVWKKENEELKLLHVHGSNAQDIPINSLAPPASRLTKDSPYFSSLMQERESGLSVKKLSFHDPDGNHRFLHPEEILYLQASGQQTLVHTLSETFACPGLLKKQAENLPANFMRIHKAYIVNTNFIHSVCRYRADLITGASLPIGRSLYMELLNRMNPSLSGSGRQLNQDSAQSQH